jgi:hypothetical protein
VLPLGPNNYPTGLRLRPPLDMRLQPTPDNSFQSIRGTVLTASASAPELAVCPVRCDKHPDVRPRREESS